MFLNLKIFKYEKGKKNEEYMFYVKNATYLPFLHFMTQYIVLDKICQKCYNMLVLYNTSSKTRKGV